MPARRPRKPAHGEAHSVSRDAQQSKFRPTSLQWRYNEAKRGYALRGQLVTQKELAKEIGCRPATVSIWNRDDRFLAWDAATMRAHRPAKLEEAILAICQRAIQGNSRYGDLVLRLLELDASKEPVEQGREGVPQTNVQLGVAFYGLPMPPTPQQAEGQRPPAGSAMVVTAAGVLEDRGRK